jgi:inosine-uridine nucleoside N-ribohydrolase
MAENKQTPVFVDCDNTMGLPGQEIDDGLTLLYLLGRTDISMVGVSATHGNGTAPEAYAQTCHLLGRIKADVPVYPAEAGGGVGTSGSSDARAGDANTDAATALVEASLRHKGLQVLGLGALTNLARAAQKDSGFFSRLGGVWLMGGYVAPLRFPRRKVNELNFSSDPSAAATVLSAPCPVTVMSAQYCLHARYGPLDLLLRRRPAWLQEHIREWYRAFSGATGARGFYLWDLVPAAAVGRLGFQFPGTSPLVRCESTVEDLTRGTLVTEPPTPDAGDRTSGVIRLPQRPFSRRAFVSHCVRHWKAGIMCKSTVE